MMQTESSAANRPHLLQVKPAYHSERSFGGRTPRSPRSGITMDIIGSRENTNVSGKMSRRGQLRMSRQASKPGLSRGNTEVSTLSVTNQPTRGSRRKGSVAISRLEEELKKTMPKGWNIREGFQALVHFKKIVRFVIVFMKWIMALREEAEKTGGGGSGAITDLTQDFASAMVTADGTTFDVKDYQSKKEVLLSSDVREILNQHPTLRTKDQVQLAKYGLQHVKSFSEYPLHMQEKLATVAYFQEVDAKRVILREGHQAENFYFILSGTARVTKLVKDADGSVELKFDKFLIKGDSFGEMELLHHSNRQTTVVSQTPMTLLCIGRDHFFDIFMASQDENSLPDHIKFIGTLEVMKGFPLEVLVENPEKCLLHFFRRGAVVVEDSVKSEWLYFIKSGTCQVLKDLKGLPPKPVKKDNRKKPAVKLPTDFSLCLPKLGSGAQPSKVSTGLKALAPPKPKTPRQQILQRSETPSNAPNNFLEGDFLSKQDDHLPLLMMEKRLLEDKEFSENYKNMMAVLDVTMEQTTPHRNAARNTKLNVGYTRSRYNNLTVIKNKKQPLMPIMLPHYAVEMNKKVPKVTFNDLDTEDTKSSKHEDDQAQHTQITPNENLLVVSPRPRVNSLGKKSSVDVTPEKPQVKQEPAPVYVQVDLLKPRDIFGLANIKFDEFMENKSLNVSLVSRGAECIMVEKKFFIEHAPQEVRHSVMSLIRPYPDIENLQGNLEIKAGWESYREDMLQMSQDRVAEKKALLKKTFSV